MRISLIVVLILSGCAKTHSEGVLAPNDPIQDEADEETFEHNGFELTRLATYEIEARVISIKSYNHDLSPLDFALGWGNMSDPKNYEPLNIKQEMRWYSYNWGPEGPPIPEKEIAHSSANTHLIPANEDIEDQLKDVDEGDVVVLKGYLVQAQKKEKRGVFTWRTSLKRTDTGGGACEILYVESVDVVFDQ